MWNAMFAMNVSRQVRRVINRLLVQSSPTVNLTATQVAASQNRLEVTEDGGGLGIKSNRGKKELSNPEVYLRQGHQKIGVP